MTSHYEAAADAAQQELDAISPTMCYAKWAQVSMHLTNGMPQHHRDSVQLTLRARREIRRREAPAQQINRNWTSQQKLHDIATCRNPSRLDFSFAFRGFTVTHCLPPTRRL